MRGVTVRRTILVGFRLFSLQFLMMLANWVWSISCRRNGHLQYLACDLDTKGSPRHSSEVEEDLLNAVQ